MASVAEAPSLKASQGVLFEFDPDMCQQCPVAPQFGGLCPGAGSEFACEPNTLNPAHPHFAELIGELGGLEFDLTRARAQPRICLPSAIPQIDGMGIGRSLGMPWKAVRLSDFWKRTRRSNASDLHEALGVDPKTKILLLLNAKDDELDKNVWHPRHQFLRSLERWRPDAVAGPSYSVWLRDSFIESEYSIVKSLRFFGLLQEHRIPAIPNIYWNDEGQRMRCARWLNDNPEVELITVDLEAMSQALEATYIRELHAFRSALVRPPSLLVSGVAREGFIRNLQAAWLNSSFTANHFIQAYKRREAIPQSNGTTVRRMVSGGDPEVLYRGEVERLEAIVSEPLRFWSDLEFGRLRAPVRQLPYEADGLWGELPKPPRRGYSMPRARKTSLISSHPVDEELPAAWIINREGTTSTGGVVRPHRN